MELFFLTRMSIVEATKQTRIQRRFGRAFVIIMFLGLRAVGFSPPFIPLLIGGFHCFPL
jgi:hypothetical protein